MERGREGRRGVVAAGSVSAARRPRTSGFKDTQAAEDGEDVMDDIHNPRLRERPKKDSIGSAAQVMPSGSLGATSRNKRKRQVSQELQGQVRSSTVDELDDTTEDIEGGASEDDDDPPPPPIPRRSGKLRPQGKFLDDGISADLPTVPRKARTVILKRPQESPSPPVGDSSHQGLLAIPRSPAPVSASSSSPVVSLKPGRRMKSSGLKIRAVKAPKVSTPTVISEQEVEVAEALSDLARMFTNQSNSSKLDVIIDTNPEPNEEGKRRLEPEVKLEASESANNTVACPQPAFPSSHLLLTSTAVSTPIVTLSSHVAPGSSPNVSLSCAVSSAIAPAVSTALVPPMTATSLPPVTGPPAEVAAPKRKRPRLRTRPDLLGCVSEVGLSASCGDVSNSCGLTVQSRGLEAVQILTSCPPITDSSSIDAEAALLPPEPTSMLVSASPSSMLLSKPQSKGLSSPGGMPGSRLLEKESISANEVKEVEVGTIPLPLHSLNSAPRDKKPAAVIVPSLLASSASQMDQALDRDELVNVDLDGSHRQEPICAHDHTPTVIGQPPKFHFDLMAPPVTKPVASPRSERILEVPAHTAEDRLKKCLVIAQAGSSVQSSWRERQKGKEGEKQAENEMQWEDGRKDRTESERVKLEEVGLGRERTRVVHRDGDSEIPLHREGDSTKEKNRGDEQGRKESEEQAYQRQGKAQKLESRAPKTERTALSTATSAAVSSFSPSAPLVASNVATGVISFPVTSAGIPSWPVGIPQMGYYSSAAAAAVWPSGPLLGGDVDENAPPEVQLPNPYTIQTRQLQPWKRCASHVYIAHFIDLQQQMNRHPFIHAAYQNSGSTFGAKPYNLNIPLPPGEALFGNVSGGPVLGCVSGVGEVSVVAGDGSGLGLGVLPSSERNLVGASTITNAQSKDSAHGEASCNKQPQLQQPSPNVASQSCPGFGLPGTQASTGAVGGLAVTSSAACGGPVGNPGSGGGSVPAGGSSASTTGSNIPAGPGASNGVVSHAVAQAQYLQAVMQQGGFSFPFQAAAHFGSSFNGPPGHTGPQQATQFFGSPFYTTHLVHPPAHTKHVPLGTNASGGLPSVQKQQQHALQQAGRNYPPASQQQPTSAPVTQSPSQSQKHHPQGTGSSQQIQHLTEREESNTGESNSSSENKFSMLQRNVYGQGNPHATVSAVNSSSTLVVGGGSQTLPPQDFSLLSAVGAKQQQGQLASQQHHASGPPLHPSFKGIDQQSQQTFSAVSIASVNRVAVVGPGPLGLAPVAAVMAPQGHAMLHAVADPSRGQTQHQQSQNQQPITAQPHQHSLQSSQHRGPVQIQKIAPAISVEDGGSLDGTTFSSRSGREPAEDRKMPSKRGMSSTSNLTRADLDTSLTVQGASSSSGILHGRITGSGGSTLNLMTPAPAILLSRPVGHPSGGGLQQQGTTPPGNQNSKQTLLRGKLLAGVGGGGALVSSTQSQVSFSERPSLGSSLPSKIQGSPLSSSGQNIPLSAQVSRHSPIAPHPQLKLSNRSTLSSLPTPSGTAPQVVLAAAIAKSQQVPQQQQSRSQMLAGTNTGPSPRLPPNNCAGTPTSITLPLPPLPLASKCAPNSASKNNLTSKTSFTLPHKPSGGVSSKRAPPPSVSQSSNLGSSPLVQNLPLNSAQNQHHPQVPSQQPQQNMSQYHTQPSNLPQSTQQHSSQLSNSLVSMQYHQQAHLSSQQQVHQVHSKQAHLQQQQTHQMHRVFLQNPAFQPLQQSSGPVLHSHPQQQSSQQLLRQTTPPPSQPQQRASSPQQQPQPQQHNSQGGPGLSPGISSNGSFSLGPPMLTLGTGSNGNSTCTRGPGTDTSATSQGQPSRANSAANKVTSAPGASLSSSRISTGGTSFLQAQFVTNVSSPSGSPRNSSGPQYLQAIANSESSSKLTEQKVTTGNVIAKPVGVQFSGSNYSEDGRPMFGGSSSVANSGAVSSQCLSNSAHQSLQLIASGPASSNSQSAGQTSTSGLQP